MNLTDMWEVESCVANNNIKFSLQNKTVPYCICNVPRRAFFMITNCACTGTGLVVVGNGT